MTRVAAPIVCLTIGACSAAPAQEPSNDERGVRLIVCVSVDQMRGDQLTRLAPWFDGGLGRFAKSGRVFAEAALEHGDTETGPGHASFGTGRHPSGHGIVGNDWLAVNESRATYCFYDADQQPVTSAGVVDARSVSPRNLRVRGIADYLRDAHPDAKSFAISSKDRSAIGMSGQRATWAVWWDKRNGGFQTSTWYASELPPWIREWNSCWLAKLAGGEFGEAWDANLPDEFENSGTAADEREGEAGRAGQRSFPHRVPSFAEDLDSKQRAVAASWVYDGPAGDVLVADVAMLAVRELELGADATPDLLCVSLTSCDTVGHAYGPFSVEVTDVLLRADRELGRLFALLDERIGADRWIAALSADHGVLELPEALAARGVDAGRLSGRLLQDALDEVRAQSLERFGRDFFLAANSRGVRLSLDQMTESGVEPAEVRRAYADGLNKACAAWLHHALTFDELRAIAREGAEAPSELARFEANSFDEERTCDVVLLQERNFLVGVAAGTTHGTPYDYDRSVPLAFIGPGVEPGISDARARSVDALPTLFTLAGLPLPEGLDGRALPTR